ncbi:MAG: hypothetical protein ACI4MP_10910, partial [Candidatus Ventricola sp.]
VVTDLYLLGFCGIGTAVRAGAAGKLFCNADTTCSHHVEHHEGRCGRIRFVLPRVLISQQN